jgi:hypothetical protein
MKKVIMIAVGLMCAAQIQAALDIYHNEADFLNAAGPLSFEGFEGFLANNRNSLLTITASGFVVSASNAELGIFDSTISGQYATEGHQYLDHQSDLEVTTTFAFNDHINAFGFDLIDFGDWGSGQLTLLTDAGDQVVVALSGAPDRNVQYFGLISDVMFTQAIFTNTIDGEAFGFDRVSYGVIPEPATLILMGLGLLALQRKGNKE